ncbi:uncharacterized protein LOC105642073 [Jatropha curcas]|uniref:uncharacterized protein LOC105642073 n=1 Tax=Jatropha curcas TaxID=180498 RepID=UPI001893D94B|nr:uncharacterized protein LOC105642073 [Jatropha curcas]
MKLKQTDQDSVMEFKNQNQQFHGKSDGDDNDPIYMEIERQILLLTADDNGDDEDFLSQRKLSSNSRRLTSSCCSCTLQHGSNHFPWWEGEKSDYDNSTPTWLLNLWSRTGSGTGVFIPHIVKSRRRYRPGERMNNEKGSIYRAKKQL